MRIPNWNFHEFPKSLTDVSSYYQGSVRRGFCVGNRPTHPTHMIEQNSFFTFRCGRSQSSSRAAWFCAFAAQLPTAWLGKEPGVFAATK